VTTTMTTAEHAIQRLQAGDAAALETLMEVLAPRVYRVAYGITRSASDAEEVVQDVFMTVLKKAQTFAARSAAWTWIYRITTNTALNKRRSRRPDMATLESHLPSYTADGHRQGDRTYLLRDWSATPDEVLLSEERRAVLGAALDALPAHYRAVLVLRDVEGLTSEEVADVLGESPSAVKARLHRARMVLREDLTRSMMAPAGEPDRRHGRMPGTPSRIR
jgi:RNA polymerase sigma-70 factor, ECF subfamily